MILVHVESLIDVKIIIVGTKLNGCSVRTTLNDPGCSVSTTVSDMGQGVHIVVATTELNHTGQVLNLMIQANA